MADGTRRKLIVSESWRRVAMRFLPKILKPPGRSKGTSRGVFVIFVGSDHLRRYSLRALRRSSRPPGLRGFSIRPAVKSSR